MADVRHTTGPLEAIGNFVRTAMTVNGGGYMIAECRDDHGNPHSYEAKANAELFATAPEMLSLLQDAITSFGPDLEGGDEWLKFACAAIAKATGSAGHGGEHG